MSLLYKPPAGAGFHHVVGPDNSDLKLISFARCTFGAVGNKVENTTDEEEIAINILGGKVSVRGTAPSGDFEYRSVGERENVFDGNATVVYLPRGSKYEVVAETDGADVAIAGTPARRDTKPTLVTPYDVEKMVVGKDNWRRDVYTAVGPNVDADRLLVGETYNPAGNWSSAPPHKHDVVRPPDEGCMEEVYFFMVDPSQGFGMMRVYSGEDSPAQTDEAYVLQNGDTVAVPYGYHPVVAGPGYKLYYLWILSGEERAYGAWSDDPAHAWLKNT